MNPVKKMIKNNESQFFGNFKIILVIQYLSLVFLEQV